MKKYIIILFSCVMTSLYANHSEIIFIPSHTASELHQEAELVKGRKELLDCAYAIATTLIVYFSRVGDIEAMEDMFEIIFTIRELAIKWGLKVKKISESGAQPMFL